MKPRKVILFSGHMIDKPGRKLTRFPPSMEPAVEREMGKILNSWGLGLQDLALCGGACGGDIIFAELCLKRGTGLEIRIPFPESLFLKESVSFAGKQWSDRFCKIKEHQNTNLFVLPEVLGNDPEQSNPYERNNLWQLETALSMGINKLRFICLWDGKSGDGPGGTKNMLDVVKSRSGKVYIIDTNNLFT